MLRKTGLTLATAAVVLAACGGASPALSDPREIVIQGIEATSDANSFHLSVALTGTFDMPEGGTISLEDTSLEADFDVDNQRAHLTFDVPALLGFSGEVIIIGTDLYALTSLTGPLWMHSVASAGDPVSDAADPEAVLAGIRDFLDTEGVEVTKLDDVGCGDGTCYQVELTIPASALDDAAGVGGDLLPSGALGEGLSLTLLFDRDDNRLAEVSTSLEGPEVGSLSVSVTFSNWDEAVTVEAPPADQVTEEGGFPL